MKVLLLVNAKAGRGRAEGAASRAERVLIGEGIDVRRLPVDSRDQEAALTSGIGQGTSAVVVCGGDGTVHWAVQRLAGTDCALGVIPSGTGNDNARSLGIPRGEPEEAAIRIARDLQRRGHVATDLARATAADGRSAFVLGVVSTGFDSSVNEWANQRPWPAGTAKYVLGMLRLLPTFRPLDYALDVDGSHRQGSGMLLCVGNGPSYGGGMRVCPQARRDDGALDVMWLSAVGKTRFLTMFPRVYAGTHVNHELVSTFRCRSIVVTAAGQVAYGDGERIGPLPVHLDCWPGALRVVGGSPRVAT